MTKAIKSGKIKGLVEKETFKVIYKEDIPTEANVLSGLFVLSIKEVEDNKTKFKARLVIGGHLAKLKIYDTLVSNSITLFYATHSSTGGVSLIRGLDFQG